MSSGFEQTKEELQRTVREVFRVLLYRRWAFLIPFCVAASAVLISSHRLPREYRAHTIFERRSPIPISRVLDQSGPVSIENMHESMRYDMMGPEAMAKVAHSLGMIDEVPLTSDGRLTGPAQRKLKGVISRLRGMLSFAPLKTGHDLDRVQIAARDSDPELVVKVVGAVRDIYFDFSRRKFLSRLGKARDFYQTESEGLLASIDLHEREIEAMERQYPYVNQETSRAGGQRAVMLEISIDNYNRRIEEHKRKISRLESRLAAIPETKLIGPPSSRPVPGLAPTEADFERERRRLMDYVQRIENDMMRNRIEKGMLPRHPTMQTMTRQRQHALTDLAALDGKLGTPDLAGEAFSDDPAVVAMRQAERQRVIMELADTRTALSVAEGQLEEATGGVSKHEELRTASYDQRTRYKQLVTSLKDERRQLGDMRGNERKLARVLDIDAKNQGIEFITIEEAATSSRPISPRAESILMLAFGVGLAFGACAVFLREFFDHTFHTATSVSFSLGIPVLEGIDEILLPADRRRMLLRKLALVPVVCLFAGVLATSGSLAYLSLENPKKFNRIVEKAGTTWNQLNVLG